MEEGKVTISTDEYRRLLQVAVDEKQKYLDLSVRLKDECEEKIKKKEREIISILRYCDRKEEEYKQRIKELEEEVQKLKSPGLFTYFWRKK